MREQDRAPQGFAERFRDVVLENLDWRAVLSKYDSPETVFYLDPPYIETEDYYPAGKIDHEALMDALRDLGAAICSFGNNSPTVLLLEYRVFTL